MKIVISLGGSLVTKEPVVKNMALYAEAIKKIGTENRIIVVVGGGAAARKAIEIARKKGANEFEQDIKAIEVTQKNAHDFANALGDSAEGQVNKNYTDIVSLYNSTKKIVVCGGTTPGQSTDGAAANLAKLIRADMMINATNIDGVYDKNPQEFKDAKKISMLDYDALMNILEKNEQSPGKYGLCDVGAVEILKTQKIPLIIIDGTDPLEIVRAVEEKHNGSVVGQ
ncbi:MAG: UMP kinase [Candidatus Aenigmarchaeota archaeon]|nr:UMP kinase [Candidatus Aenigmarchaeota archaeon]